jgi:hypothetical protein
MARPPRCSITREKVGDAQFIEVRQFYRDNRFRPASFDIRKSFRGGVGSRSAPYFDQWILTSEHRSSSSGGRRPGASHHRALAGTAGRSFALDVPVVIGTDQGIETKSIVPADRARRGGRDLKAARRGDRSAVPALSSPGRWRSRRHYRSVQRRSADRWARRRVPLCRSGQAWTRDQVGTTDSEITALPADRAVWLFGAGNKFAPVVADALKGYGASLDAAGLRTSSTAYDAAGRSLVAVARHPGNPDSVVIALTASSEASADALARKLPHYGKYSWLVFAGDGATNGRPAGGRSATRRSRAISRRRHQPIKLTPRQALAEIKPLFEFPAV